MGIKTHILEGQRVRNGPLPNRLPSIIRWAGSKRLLLPKLLDSLPREFNTYYEPMLGSGALFFALQPETAVLADINSDLMDFLRTVKSRPRSLHAALSRIPVHKGFYDRMRATRPRSLFTRAVRFYYLIRLSWNGIYRVNRQGGFNVPFSGRHPSELLGLETMLASSRALRKASLRHGDFAETTSDAQPGDFVFFDPPYPKGSSVKNGFNRYSSNGFDLEEHARLARCALKLAHRGIKILITEAARREILKLYSSRFQITIVRNPSLIAASAEARRDAYEAILTSYRARR